MMLRPTSVRWKRLLVCLGILLVQVAALPMTAASEHIRVVVDGRELSFDALPRIVDGRTLVPMRAIFEALGARVGWDGATRTVTGTRGETTVALQIGSARAVVAGKTTTLDVPAQILADRTFVPLRFVGEALGAGVTWEAATRTVIITSPPPAPSPAPGLAPAPVMPTPKPKPQSETAPAKPAPPVVWRESLPSAGLTGKRVPHLMYEFPAPPVAERIELVPEDDGWHLQVTGRAGAVAPNVVVMVSGIQSGESVLTRSDTRGGFQVRLVAPPDSFVQVKHDPLGLLNAHQIAAGEQHPGYRAPGTLLRVPAPSDLAGNAAAQGKDLAFHATGYADFRDGARAVPWVLAGEISGLPAQPGGSLHVRGELRFYLPSDRVSQAPERVDMRLALDRLSRADGRPVLMQQAFMSTTLTPTGLPITHIYGHNPTDPDCCMLGYANQAPLMRADPLTMVFPVDAQFDLPADLEDGWYRLQASAWLPGLRLDRPLYGITLSPGSIRRDVRNGLLPPFPIGSTAPARLPWMLLADTPSQGSRGTIAREDEGSFQFASMIVHQSDRLIIPKDDPATGRPIAYRLEPHLPTVAVADRRLVDAPALAFKLPSGRLQVQVQRPDGQVDDLGEAPFAQHMSISPQTAAGHYLDNGGGNAGDIYQLTTGSERFLYRFPDYGRYVVRMTGVVEDIWGNRYPGGGSYEVWVARPLELRPGLLPDTPFQVGNVVAPSLTVYPGVPADVEWRWRFYPQSRPDQAEEVVVRSRANRFGYFHPDQPPGPIGGPGEYRLDLAASYTDPGGQLWMGSMTWGQVVEKPGTPLVLHGRRGIDEGRGPQRAWFTRRSTGVPTGDSHFFYPYHNGDVAWQSLADAIKVSLSLQDTRGEVADLILQRAKATSDGKLAQRTAAGEAPVLSTSHDLHHPAYHPDRVDQHGYWYGAAVRADARVREMVSEDSIQTTYWRFTDMYAGQLGIGTRGDLPGDLKWLFGGVVWSHEPAKIYETAIYGSLWVALPDDDPVGSRTMPPFQGNGGGPDGGPILRIAGKPVDIFFLPLGVRPGTVLTVGDTFSFSGQVGPPLNSHLTATVTAPSGRRREISGQASKIGYFYDPAADFTVDEPGLWTVKVEVEHRDRTSAGPLTPPYPRGGILSTTAGVYHFYVVPDEQPELEWNLPAAGLIPGHGPVVLAGRIPEGWTDAKVHYSIGMSGYLLAEGQAERNGDSFVVRFEPIRLAPTFPNIDDKSRYHPDTEGLADTFTVSLLLAGRDPDGRSAAVARLVTIRGPELYAPAVQAGP